MVERCEGLQSDTDDHSGGAGVGASRDCDY